MDMPPREKYIGQNALPPLSSPICRFWCFVSGVTLFALERGFLKDNRIDQEALSGVLEGVSLRFEHETGDLYLNGENVSQKIRLPNVSDHVSAIAALSIVREFLLYQQRQMAHENGLVMDGRDIGTVVFPNADHKFFFTARREVRPAGVMKNSKLKVKKRPLRKF